MACGRTQKRNGRKKRKKKKKKETKKKKKKKKKEKKKKKDNQRVRLPGGQRLINHKNKRRGGEKGKKVDGEGHREIAFREYNGPGRKMTGRGLTGNSAVPTVGRESDKKMEKE